MKILVTGAHGFVGTRLMKELEGAICRAVHSGNERKNRSGRSWRRAKQM